jgi:hypothetical protein
MVGSSTYRAVVVASEPISCEEWREVPNNSVYPVIVACSTGRLTDNHTAAGVGLAGQNSRAFRQTKLAVGSVN